MYRSLLVAFVVLLVAVPSATAAPPGPWDAFNLSPGADRTQLPTAVTARPATSATRGRALRPADAADRHRRAARARLRA